MNQPLQEQLRALLSRDEGTRAELAASGELFDGYHPRMARVHSENAAALEAIVEQWGWPGHSLVGEAGCQAAWIVLQHAIADPGLQRRCLVLLKAAADAGEIPARHAAFLEDRIRCFEGRPQRYGTQLDWDESGQLSPLPLADPDSVDRLRESVGLESLSDRVAEARAEAEREGAKPPEDVEQYRREKVAWARSVGWL